MRLQNAPTALELSGAVTKRTYRVGAKRLQNAPTALELSGAVTKRTYRSCENRDYRFKYLIFIKPHLPGLGFEPELPNLFFKLRTGLKRLGVPRFL